MYAITSNHEVESMRINYSRQNQIIRTVGYKDNDGILKTNDTIYENNNRLKVETQKKSGPNISKHFRNNIRRYSFNLKYHLINNL